MAALSPTEDERVDMVSLFAGIGGIDVGLTRGDPRLRTVLLAEIHPDAQTVLRQHFPDVPIVDDVRELVGLPSTARVVTAGSPCCDFSVANTAKRGLEGDKSSLLREVFRLLRASPHVEHLVLENVANMLHLRGGEAVEELGRELRALGFAFAFRVLDARAFGLRQRRRRLICVARRRGGVPWWVVRSSVAPPREDKRETPREFAAFSWVDGNRGCGFVNDSVPTLRAHDTPLYIRSQPALIDPFTGRVGILSCEDGEALQGLPVGWTECIPERRRYARIGNAVPVPVFEWIGRNLLVEGGVTPVEPAPTPRGRCAIAGIGDVDTPLQKLSWVTEWPQLPSRQCAPPLAETPLSAKAIRGFLARAAKGKAGMPDWALETLRRAAE